MLADQPSIVLAFLLICVESAFIKTPEDHNVLEDYNMDLYFVHNETDINSCMWKSESPETTAEIFLTYDYHSGIGGSNNVGWEFLNPEDPCRAGIRKRRAQQTDAQTYRMGISTKNNLILSRRFKVNVIQARDRSIDLETDNVRATLLPGRDVNVTLPTLKDSVNTTHPFVVRLNKNFPNDTKVTIQIDDENNTIFHEVYVNKTCEVKVEILPSMEIKIQVLVEVDIVPFHFVDICQIFKPNDNYNNDFIVTKRNLTQQEDSAKTTQENFSVADVVHICLLSVLVLFMVAALILLQKHNKTIARLENEIGTRGSHTWQKRQGALINQFCTDKSAENLNGGINLVAHDKDFVQPLLSNGSAVLSGYSSPKDVTDKQRTL